MIRVSSNQLQVINQSQATYSRVVPVQLDPDGVCGAKGALEGQRVSGAVFKVRVGVVDTKFRLLSL